MSATALCRAEPTRLAGDEIHETYDLDGNLVQASCRVTSLATLPPGGLADLVWDEIVKGDANGVTSHWRRPGY